MLLALLGHFRLPVDNFDPDIFPFLIFFSCIQASFSLVALLCIPLVPTVHHTSINHLPLCLRSMYPQASLLLPSCLCASHACLYRYTWISCAPTLFSKNSDKPSENVQESGYPDHFAIDISKQPINEFALKTIFMLTAYGTELITWYYSSIWFYFLLTCF